MTNKTKDPALSPAERLNYTTNIQFGKMLEELLGDLFYSGYNGIALIKVKLGVTGAVDPKLEGQFAIEKLKAVDDQFPADKTKETFLFFEVNQKKGCKLLCTR